MDWFTGHTELINTIANVGILLVWLIYAQLLYLNFARQRRPTILINQVQGYGLNSTCMVSNMSREPIHIECIIAEIDHGEKSSLFNVADYKIDADHQSVQDLKSLTHQGPLGASGYTSLGMFGDLIRRALTADGKIDDIGSDRDLEKILSETRSVEIRVIGDYGPETRLIGAYKRFLVKRGGTGEILIYPEEFRTHQLIGFRARHFILPRWYARCIPEQQNYRGATSSRRHSEPARR